MNVLIYLITQKFSARTRSEWNLKRSTLTEIPSYKDLRDFLTLRIRGLSDLSDSHKDSGLSKSDKPRSSTNNVSTVKCVCCSGEHHVSKCDAFQKRAVAQRCALIRQHKLCFNCLRSGHFPIKCPSKFRCRQCGRAHHTLLHSADYERSDDPEHMAAAKSAPSSGSAGESNASSTTSAPPVATVQTVPPADNRPPNVLLATAWVDLHTMEGRCLRVRALLDQGSTFSFISESLCQALRTKRQRTDLQIRCFGDKFTGMARSSVSLLLTPRSKSVPNFPLTAYVFQRITSYAASRVQPFESWPHLQGLCSPIQILRVTIKFTS